MKAIVMNSAGGFETLEYIERPDPVPVPGRALVEIAFAGVNFMDTGALQGTVWAEMPNPKILGVEGMGRVLAVGEDVEDVAPGQRVAWINADGAPHGLKFGDGASGVDPLLPGAQFERTFEKAGTFDYVCSVHPYMTGRVVVRAP